MEDSASFLIINRVFQDTLVNIVVAACFPVCPYLEDNCTKTNYT